MVTQAERQRQIDSYGAAADELAAALPEFPRAMWRFKPAPGLWSIHEIVIHLTDSEANSFVRCRRAIAEPGQAVTAYDENQWASGLDYHAQSPDEAVELFRLLRRNTYHLIQRLPQAVWAHTLDHPEKGRMTLDDWLGVYERHVRDHVAQMRTVYAAWQAAGAPDGE